MSICIVLEPPTITIGTESESANITVTRGFQCVLARNAENYFESGLVVSPINNKIRNQVSTDLVAYLRSLQVNKRFKKHLDDLQCNILCVC